MLSNRNVVRGYQVSYDDPEDTAVIDSNARARALIEAQEREYLARKLAAERERRLEELRASGGEIPEGVDPDEFLGLADAIMQGGKEKEPEPEPEPEIDYVAEAKAEAEQILNDARNEAEQIISAAEVNAEALKKVAQQDGERDGYNAGTQQAALELKQAKDAMNAEMEALRQDYLDRQTTLEHDMVEMCLGVFEKVFSAELAGRKDVIYHLLDTCIMNIERSKQMQIRVSEANADFVRSKKSELQERVGSDVNFDIIADPMMNDSQCTVETDGGIFDCSIDTELDNLLRALKALA